MWYNRFTIGLLTSPLHFLLSGSMIVLRISGRKSGRRFDVPVNYIRVGTDPVRLLITSQSDRTWWRNLRGGVPLEVCLRGQWRQARGVVFEDADRVEAGLVSLFNARPGNARFFNVRADESGGWNAEDLERESGSRVVIEIEMP